MSLYTEKTTFYSRYIVKEILMDVERYGLIGRQHFYIQLSLNSTDLVIPDRVRLRYAADGVVLLIIRKNEYANLSVSDFGFKIELGFDGIGENVFVPFTAITNFSDPSENFALEFIPEYQMKSITHEQYKSSLSEKKGADNNIIIFPNTPST
jgi:hypothetical protein